MSRSTAGVLHPGLLERRAPLARRFRSARPFKHVVVDGFLAPEFCRALIGEFPPYDDRRFRNEHGHRGKAHREDVAALGPAFRRLDGCFRSEGFRRLVSGITAIPELRYDPSYFGGGTHENLEDMELDPHVDFNLHPDNGMYRRVNLLLYLNPEWRKEWGGALELHVDPWSPPGEDRIKTIAPAFNRCVLFETSDRSWHGFQTIRLPEGKAHLSRRSFALYLYTKEAPPNVPVIPPDLTVFVDRPLPGRLRAGRRLTPEDVALLERLIVRRDWKLKYLYDRAITIFNELRRAEAQRDLAREALARGPEAPPEPGSARSRSPENRN